MGPMSARSPRPDPARPGRVPTVVAILMVAVLSAACGSAATPSPSPAAPTPTPSASAGASPAGSPGASLAPSADAPSPSTTTTQTDTDWGRIWDDVPASFPVLDGASPVQADEAISLAYEVSAPPKAVAEMLQADLEAAAFSTESMSGPLEDGSFIIASTGDDACRVETRVVPMGTTTRVLVRYGATCPFE
jgi:hypothetical protein